MAFLTKGLKNNKHHECVNVWLNFITYKTYFSIQVCDEYHKQTSIYALYLETGVEEWQVYQKYFFLKKYKNFPLGILRNNSRHTEKP